MAESLQRNQNATVHGLSIYSVDYQLYQGIERHFSQYGEITSINFSGEFAFIRFKSAVSSNAAMAIREHNIEHNGAIVTVKVAPYCPNIFIDDCLEKIFRHLCLADLCSVADVCTKFKRIAQTVFAPRFYLIEFNSSCIYHPAKDVNIEEAFNSAKIFDLSINIDSPRFKQRSNQQLKSLFQNFGHFIKFLETNSIHGEYEDRVLQHFALHAPNENCELIKLKVNELNINAQTVRDLIPKLARLQSLEMSHIKRTKLFDVGRLIQGCQNMTTLRTSYTILPHIDGKMKKLENVSFVTTTFAMPEFDEFAFERFAHHNQQLKRLLLYVKSKKKSNILHTIGTSLHKLEDLSIRGKCRGLNLTAGDFAELKQLRKLFLNIRGLPATEFFKALANGMIPLEELYYYADTTITSDMVQSIITMKQIKKIEMRLKNSMFGGMRHVLRGDSLLITLARELPHLSHLVARPIEKMYVRELIRLLSVAKELTFISLNTWFTITTDDLMRIVELVKNRNNGTKLVVDIGVQLDLWQSQIAKENSQWLQFQRH